MGHWARRCWSATTAAVATSSSWASSQPRPIPWWCFSAGQCWRGGGLVHRQTNPHKSSMFCSVRVFWGTAWDLYMFADYKLLWSIIERQTCKFCFETGSHEGYELIRVQPLLQMSRVHLEVHEIDVEILEMAAQSARQRFKAKKKKNQNRQSKLRHVYECKKRNTT